MLYVVYRGSVSFTLTARGEGELLQNDQVVLMMRLALCVIWISLIQHIVFTCPYTGLPKYTKNVLNSDNEDEGVSEWVNRMHIWLSQFLIRRDPSRSVMWDSSRCVGKR